MDKLYIIMPAYNEEANIKTVAKQWYPVVESAGGESRLVIIDDGSKDSTYSELLKLKESMPMLEPITKQNSGHGATVLFGYNYALQNGADYIFQTDSDGQTLPEEFESFWQNRNNYSAQIGHRKHRKDGASRVFVTKVLKLVLRIIFGVSITDANTPFRLIKHATLKKYIEYIPENFNLSNVLLTVLLVKNNENIRFKEITFRPRQGGVNSINFKRIFKIGIQAVRDFRQIKKSLKMAGENK